MTTTTNAPAATTQVYRVYIKASAQAIWDAITRPEWTARYGYTGLVDYELRPGGAYKVRPSDGMRAGAAANGHTIPDVILEGTVLEAEPPHRLVTTFRMLMNPETANEPETRVTHEIVECDNNTCMLTVVHELEGAPKLALMVSGTFDPESGGGGWAWIISDLKTLLETGESF